PRDLKRFRTNEVLPHLPQRAQRQLHVRRAPAASIQRIDGVFERFEVADEQVAFAMPVCPFFRPARGLNQWLKQNAVYAEFFGPLRIFGQLRRGFTHDNTDQRDGHCGPLTFNAANYFGDDVVESRNSAMTVVNGRILAVEREGDGPQAGVHQVAIVSFGLKGQTIRDEVDGEPEMNGPADDVVDSRLQEDLSADQTQAERAGPRVQFIEQCDPAFGREFIAHVSYPPEVAHVATAVTAMRQDHGDLLRCSQSTQEVVIEALQQVAKAINGGLPAYVDQAHSGSAASEVVIRGIAITLSPFGRSCESTGFTPLTVVPDLSTRRTTCKPGFSFLRFPVRFSIT